MNIKLAVALCLAFVGCVWTQESRIIGGDNANIANFNYQASLRLQGVHNCGAVLISATRALTAAHCIGGALSAYSILAGTTDRNVVTCATCVLRSPPIAVTRHPAFSNNPSAGYPNDIGLVWFHSIATNANVGYATLATDNDGNFAGDTCFVSGWGRTTPTGALPSTLQSGTLTVITNEACIGFWNANRIRPEQICAGQQSVATCNGDEGGPLVCNRILAGISSFGDADCKPEVPSVFSRVSSYRDWILENSTA